MTSLRHPLIIVGAYPAAAGALESAAQEDRWYGLLREASEIDGLELAHAGSLHQHGAQRLAELLHPGWRNVVATIPSTIAMRADHPQAGLASEDDAGRRRAIDGIRKVFDDISELKALVGSHAVAAVELVSAPTRTATALSSASSFAQSLEDIARWDWGTTELVIEHCDAATAAHPHQKGYLTLEEEMEAVRVASTPDRPIRQSINWGRSAIEGRSARLAESHIAALAEQGTLAGVIFSGACDVDGPWGDAWADAHAPLGESPDDPTGCLMTTAHVEKCLAAAGTLSYTGIKVQTRDRTSSLEQRVNELRDGLAPILGARR